MDPKRLSNSYFHVFKNCDSKKFAQKKGIEQKQKWLVEKGGQYNDSDDI